MACRCEKKSDECPENTADFCTNCFLNHAEKKVKKTLKKAGIKKGDKILLINDKTAKGVVNEFLFRSIIKGLPLEIHIKASFDENDLKIYEKIIIPDSLDDSSERILIGILNAEQLDENNKIARLLENLSEKEIEACAKIKNLVYESAHKKSRILSIFDKIEQYYPGSKLSFIKAVKELRQL